MRRTSLVSIAIALGALGWAALGTLDGRAGPAPDGLPGARADIEAIRYPSIQAAVDALPAQGGVVRLPVGTFEIDRPIVISGGDVLLIGSGSATHIRNANEEGQPAISVRPATIEPGRKTRIWRVKLADLRISGNEKSGHGIEATGVNEIFIQGVTVSEHGGDGIRLADCYEDPRISDSLITYNKQAGLDVIACHDIVVSANQFEENLDAVRCVDSFNLCMTGNNVDDHLRDGVVIENTYGSVVSGNMIEECRGRAIVLDRDCYGITLGANVIAHNASGGIHLRDAHGSTVSANTFTVIPKDALVIGPESGRIAVTGNTFADSYLGNGRYRSKAEDRTASGLTLDGTSDVTVSGNLFSGVGPRAIAATERPSTRVLISGNILADAEGEHDRERLRDSVATGNLEGPGDD